MKNLALAALALIAAPACGGLDLPDLSGATKSPALSVSAPEAQDGAGFGKPPEAGPGDPADALMEKLAVTSKLKGYTPDDSANLQKVGEALLAATPEMWVHVIESPSDKTERYDFVATPQDSFEIPAEFPKKTEKKSALSKYGGDLVPVVAWNSSDLDFNIYPGYPGPFAVNTTGLVWNLKSGCVFVTLDGGRYQIPCRFLGKGVPHTNEWPPPLRHALLTPFDVKKLAELGALPKASAAELEAARGDWDACVKKTGAPAKAELDASSAKKGDAASQRAQGEVIAEKYKAKQLEACKAKLDKISAVLVKIIEARSAERRSLYDKVAAKLGGAKK